MDEWWLRNKNRMNEGAKIETKETFVQETEAIVGISTVKSGCFVLLNIA